MSAVGVVLVPGLLLFSRSIGYDFQVAGIGIALVVGLIGVALIAGSWLLLPLTSTVRARALALIGGGVMLSLLLSLLVDPLLSWRLGLALRVLLCLPAGLSAWFLVRGRQAGSFAWLPVLLIGLATYVAPSYLFAWIPLPIAIILTAVLAGVTATSEPAAVKNARLAADREQAAIADQAVQIQRWQAAYALANPGQPIPAPPLMYSTGGGASAGDGTNVLAILALVFGVLGGLLAIPFGHIALSQIKRSGAGGRGIAIAGLILGYVWLVVVIVRVILNLR